MDIAELRRKFDAKPRSEKLSQLLLTYRPQRRLRGVLVYHLMKIGAPPQPKRNAAQRTLKQLETLDDDMHFLAGVIVQLRDDSVRRTEAEKLLLDGWYLMHNTKVGAANIRKLRLHSEKILRIVEKIERDMKRDS